MGKSTISMTIFSYVKLPEGSSFYLKKWSSSRLDSWSLKTAWGALRANRPLVARPDRLVLNCLDQRLDQLDGGAKWSINWGTSKLTEPQNLIASPVGCKGRSYLPWSNPRCIAWMRMPVVVEFWWAMARKRTAANRGLSSPSSVH